MGKRNGGGGVEECLFPQKYFLFTASGSGVAPRPRFTLSWVLSHVTDVQCSQKIKCSPIHWGVIFTLVKPLCWNIRMAPSHENLHLICFALRLISMVTSITIVTNRSTWHHLQRTVHGDLWRYWFSAAVRGSGGPAGRDPGRLPHLVPRSQQVPRPRTWGHCRLGGVSTRQRLCCSGNFNHNLIQKTLCLPQ